MWVFFFNGRGLLWLEIHLAIWNSAADELLGMFFYFFAESGMLGMIITSEQARLRFYEVTFCTLLYRDFSPYYSWMVNSSFREQFCLKKIAQLLKAVLHKS